MKIGKFGHRGEWSSPDSLDRTIYPDDEEVRLRSRYFKQYRLASLGEAEIMLLHWPCSH